MSAKDLSRKKRDVERGFSVPSLTRGMAVMELLAKHAGGLGLVEIAEALGIPNNAVFRIASALVELGYLHRDDRSRKFSLGSKLLTLGLNTVHEVNIVERSNELMRRFRDEVNGIIGDSLLKDHIARVPAHEDRLHARFNL